MAADNKFTGILLAGGESRRFGTPKALAELDGKRFFERAIDIMSPFVSATIICSHSSLAEIFRSENIGIVVKDRDDVRGKGPLAGIVTAMATVSSQWYIVIPCDMPLLHRDILRVLVTVAKQNPGYDVVVPKVGGKIQHLVGIYHQRCQPVIEDMLAHHDYKVTHLLDKVNVAYIEKGFHEQIECFNNVNTKEDFETILSLQRGIYYE